MPQMLENKLKAEARKKFPNDKERQDKYVFGALHRMGWKQGEKK